MKYAPGIVWGTEKRVSDKVWRKRWETVTRKETGRCLLADLSEPSSKPVTWAPNFLLQQLLGVTSSSHRPYSRSKSTQRQHIRRIWTPLPPRNFPICLPIPGSHLFTVTDKMLEITVLWPTTQRSYIKKTLSVLTHLS